MSRSGFSLQAAVEVVGLFAIFANLSYRGFMIILLSLSLITKR